MIDKALVRTKYDEDLQFTVYRVNIMRSLTYGARSLSLIAIAWNVNVDLSNISISTYNTVCRGYLQNLYV